MKFFVATFLTALLAFGAGIWLPWWSIAIAAFLVAVLVHQKAGKAFLAGCTGVFLLWLLLAWLRDSANDSLLSKKISMILPLGGNVILLLLVTALVGGLVAGFGALSGSYLRSRG